MKLQAETWKNRIIGHGEEDPSQLLANPYNYRIHTEYQQKALKGVLDDVGWVRGVLVNKQTGHVVDGHLRVTLAMRHHEPRVPVDYIDVSEREEQLLIAALDPIAGLAGIDAKLLAELGQKVDIAPFWREDDYKAQFNFLVV